MSTLFDNDTGAMFSAHGNRDTGAAFVQVVGTSATTITLLNGVTALGNSAASGPVDAGSYIFTVDGTFGGATVKLQWLGLDGTTWHDFSTAIALTAAGTLGVVLGQNSVVRAVASGGSGPYLLYAGLS